MILSTPPVLFRPKLPSSVRLLASQVLGLQIPHLVDIESPFRPHIRVIVILL